MGVVVFIAKRANEANFTLHTFIFRYLNANYYVFETSTGFVFMACIIVC